TPPSLLAVPPPRPTAGPPLPAEPVPSPISSEPAAREAAPRPADVEVVVLNNTTTSGLAGDTAADLRADGWQVALVGNFIGSIPASTVYYPDGRDDEARVLADALGIDGLHPSFEGVSSTRLTAVLTKDFVAR
ncbi:MAG: LytR C-terminal domain-containing protein, partial [Actinomycetes bacterium]